MLSISFYKVRWEYVVNTNRAIRCVVAGIVDKKIFNYTNKQKLQPIKLTH